MKGDKQKGGPPLNTIQGGASSSEGNKDCTTGRKDQRSGRRPRNRKCMAYHEESHWIQDSLYMTKLLKTIRDKKKP